MKLKTLNPLNMDSEDYTIGSLYVLYLGKLQEFGLLEGEGTYQLTTKGFDLAIDAYDKGQRLSEEEIMCFIEATDGMEEIKTEVFYMIERIQRIGFEETKKELEALK
jgi:hypothetical protein